MSKQMQNVNVNELQANISQVVRDVEGGQVYRVMRYSKPVAVLIPFEDYEHLQGNCQKCVGEIKENLKKIAAK